MIKGSTDQEDVTVINIYPPNIRVPKHMVPTLSELKGEIRQSYNLQKTSISYFQ